MTNEVTFEPVDRPINDIIDDACGSKNHGCLYLDGMISTRALCKIKGHAARD